MHGIMPKSASNSSSRVQRARTAASKPNVKPEKKKLKREEREIKKEVKLEPVDLAEEGDEEPNRVNGEFISPRRAVKNLSRESHSAELQVDDHILLHPDYQKFSGHLEGSQE